VQFEYELIPNTSDPKYDPSKPALLWKGERFQLVTDENLLTDAGARTRAGINWRRFMGHATKMLNRSKEQCTNGAEVAGALKQRIDGDTRLSVRVRCQYRPAKPPSKYINKTEFVLENLSA
jgi:hypothetical protein